MQFPSSEGPNSKLRSVLRRSGMGVHPLEWRLPPIETYPAVVAFAQTHAGKLVLFAVFAALMKVVSGGMWIEDHWFWLLMTIAAAVVSLAGRHRHLALLVCTAALLVHDPKWFDFSAVHATLEQENLSRTINAGYLRAGTLVAYFLLAAAALYLARRYRDHTLGRRPVLAQHILYFCMLGLAVSHLLHGLPQVLLLSMTVIFSSYFWYLAYALIDQRHRQPAPVLFQFATFNPFHFSTVIPMGKGAANWRSVEAGTAEELAVTQLKGLKLLVWALLLKALVLWAYRWGVYEKLGVPRLTLAFESYLQGRDVPVPFGIFSVIANFPEKLLILAIGGHVVIATARLAGFRLLRNTWRPLSSRTIAEFWNRYFYYFKEILVHVYFYPTYVRWFKRHPRFRIGFATFMAAGVGNYFFHFMENYTIVKYGLLEALIRSQTYAFYCVVLVAGIVVSQLRARRPDAGAGWLRGRFVPALGVAAFFCFLLVFDGPHSTVTLAQHFDFLFQAFRVDRWIKAIG